MITCLLRGCMSTTIAQCYTATERDNVYKPRVQNVFLGIIYVFSTV